METPDVFHQIKEETLNPKYYFQSLVEQAFCCGLLSEEELSEIRAGLLVILAEQTDKWSGGKSSSVPLEKAEDIMASVMFVIGIQLKSYQTPEQAVDVLKSETLRLLFESGLKLIERKMAVSRRLQKKILGNLLDTPNVYYRSTIADGINGFFKLYRPQFSAHEIHITADYPVFIGRPELNGIEFIERYLSCIQAENAFCVCFASEDIHNLLCGITHDYRSVPLNIFEPLLLSALGLIICGRNPKCLDLTKSDISLLYCAFHGKSKIELQSCIKRAIFSLNEKMELPEISIRYASLCVPKLADAILNAAKMRTLDKVFPIPACPERESEIVISYGDRMDDNKYQELVEKILRTDSSEEKAVLILREVHSLADLLDILSDAELCKNEFDIIVNLLPLPVFAMLMSQYPDDNFLNRECELFLFAALQKRKRRLPEKESQQIERLMKTFRHEEI